MTSQTKCVQTLTDLGGYVAQLTLRHIVDEEKQISREAATSASSDGKGANMIGTSGTKALSKNPAAVSKLGRSEPVFQRHLSLFALNIPGL